MRAHALHQAYTGPRLLGGFWLVSIALLCTLGIIALFSFTPFTTSIVLSIGLAVVLFRSRMNAHFAGIVSSVAFLILLVTAALTVDRDRRYSPYFGPYHRSGEAYVFAPQLNIAIISNRLGEVSVGFNSVSRMGVSGDVLLQTAAYQRRIWANELRCDERCIALLRQPAVTSVTIKPTPNIWLTGPRAVMPGFVPDTRTFSIKDSLTCRRVWKGTAPSYANQPRGAAIEAFRRAMDRDERCLFSVATPGDAVFDQVFETEFELRERPAPFVLPPGAVI